MYRLQTFRWFSITLSTLPNTSYPSCWQKLNLSNVRERTLNVVIVRKASSLLHSFVGPSPGKPKVLSKDLQGLAIREGVE